MPESDIPTPADLIVEKMRRYLERYEGGSSLRSQTAIVEAMNEILDGAPVAWAPHDALRARVTELEAEVERALSEYPPGLPHLSVQEQARYRILAAVPPVPVETPVVVHTDYETAMEAMAALGDALDPMPSTWTVVVDVHGPTSLFWKWPTPFSPVPAEKPQVES